MEVLGIQPGVCHSRPWRQPSVALRACQNQGWWRVCNNASKPCMCWHHGLQGGSRVHPVPGSGMYSGALVSKPWSSGSKEYSSSSSSPSSLACVRDQSHVFGDDDSRICSVPGKGRAAWAPLGGVIHVSQVGHRPLLQAHRHRIAPEAVRSLRHLQRPHPCSV